jgi:hypothetical protein
MVARLREQKLSFTMLDGTNAEHKRLVSMPALPGA